MLQRVPLTDMGPSETGTVVEILGGRGICNRLNVLGIRPGVKVTRVNAASTRGPVVLQVGGTQVSLGFGASYKVILEMNNAKNIADG